MDRGQADRLLAEVRAWSPEHGVLSVYADADPADRSEGWLIAIRNGLRELVSEAPAHPDRPLVSAAAERVLERLDGEGPPPGGRGQVGFLEVGGEQRERWLGVLLRPPAERVVRAARPYLCPLVRLLDQAPDCGVVVLSTERVRVLEWSLGRLDQLEDAELELFSLDWRERKAERRDPARGTGASAAGRDQYGQRLDANRERFLHEIGGRVERLAGERGWPLLIAFGDEHSARELSAGLGPQRAEQLHVRTHDLIRAGEGKLLGRVDEALAELNRERERRLVEAIEEGIGAERGAALGPKAVGEALELGRVRHLVVDPDRDGAGPGELPASETLIAQALATGAAVTAVGAQAAQALARHDGVAALLRY